MYRPFDANSDAVDLAVTAVSDRVALPGTGEQIRLANAGTADLRYRLCSSSGVAVTTDAYLKAGACEVVSKNRPNNLTATHVAAICGTTTTLNVQTGIGT